MTKPELRRKYHAGMNRDGSRSVSVPGEQYEQLKHKAEELDCTIKSLLAYLIDKHIPTLELEDSE